MRAVGKENKRHSPDVLTIGEMDDPQPLAGEGRIRVAFSGVNPGDLIEHTGKDRLSQTANVRKTTHTSPGRCFRLL